MTNPAKIWSVTIKVVIGDKEITSSDIGVHKYAVEHAALVLSEDFDKIDDSFDVYASAYCDEGVVRTAIASGYKDGNKWIIEAFYNDSLSGLEYNPDMVDWQEDTE